MFDTWSYRNFFLQNCQPLPNRLPRYPSSRCMRWERFASLPNLTFNLMGVGGWRTYMNSMRFQHGANAMRCFLVIGLLITLCASASAATARHPRHVIVHPDQAYTVPGWAYEPVRPPVQYGDTPSYDDPSKFGGGTAL
jgi:hypothetical protein